MIIVLPTRFVKRSRVLLPAFWDCSLFCRHVMWSVPGACKTQLFCAMYDTQHMQSQLSTFFEKQNTGSLTVNQAVYKVPAPGVTRLEDFIRSWEANKTNIWEQHVSKTLHSLVRRRLLKNRGNIPGLASTHLATAVVRSFALLRVSDPKWTVGHVGGGRIKCSGGIVGPAQSADSVFSGTKLGIGNSFDLF